MPTLYSILNQRARRWFPSDRALQRTLVKRDADYLRRARADGFLVLYEGTGRFCLHIGAVELTGYDDGGWKEAACHSGVEVFDLNLRPVSLPLGLTGAALRTFLRDHHV